MSQSEGRVIAAGGEDPACILEEAQREMDSFMDSFHSRNIVRVIVTVARRNHLRALATALLADPDHDGQLLFGIQGKLARREVRAQRLEAAVRDAEDAARDPAATRLARKAGWDRSRIQTGLNRALAECGRRSRPDPSGESFDFHRGEEMIGQIQRRFEARWSRIGR